MCLAEEMAKFVGSVVKSIYVEETEMTITFEDGSSIIVIPSIDRDFNYGKITVWSRNNPEF